MFRTPTLFALALTVVATGVLAVDTCAQAGSGTLINQKPHSTFAGPGLGAGVAAPEWKNRSWLNTPGDQPLALRDLRGQVVLLNFWTFTCWNCTGALPSLVAFDSLYRDQGLTIIGIHRPEFPPYAGEHDRKNVAAALVKHHIRYANAQDNDSGTWDLYGIQYWPSFTLIDKKGRIRYEGYGEFHVGDQWHRLWDRRIRELLAE